MADKLLFEILEDGTVSVKTESFSEANHASADALLEEIEKELGGTRTTEARERPAATRRIVRPHRHVRTGR
jgi:hypothetical protein